MELSDKEKKFIADKVWENNAHKDKIAAIHAMVIMFSAKIAEDDVSTVCQVMRIPISMGAEIRAGLRAAAAIKKYSKEWKNGNKDTKHS